MQRANHPSDKLIGEVAWMYYVKNLTQGEIATALSISRPTIISYLKLAMERGIVNIRLLPEHLRLNDLSERLRERYGLDQVHVVPTDGLGETESLQAVCEVAAHVLPALLNPGDELGVSWGQTVSFVSEAVPRWPIADLVVRQLIGSLANPLIQTSEGCTMEIARRLSGTCINLNAPAVCTNAALAEALKNEPIIREQIDNLARCNKAIFSLSPCTPDTHVVQFKIASAADVARYRAAGAVGIIVGRFVDAEGQPVIGELDERLIGADLQTLRRMEGLMVVAGIAKADATRAALRGAYAKNLVIEERLAEAI